MKHKRIALLFICLNPPYWPYVRQVIEDCNKYFLTNHTDGHSVDFFLWTDIPEGTNYGATVFPTEPIEWPAPTLMRYHLFLQQEELLKDYDYLFYMDADMRVVDFIESDILGEGLTAAQHPMYALRPQYWLPYEPNPKSTAYIPQTGKMMQGEKGPYFQPLYYAGGFQGGETKAFIKAMKVMRKNIDKDYMNNYTARWNDESHWNKYLSENPPAVVLSPSYIYPDSLIKEYYIPLWGQDYKPKIITLTKPFSVTKEGGQAVRKMLGEQTPSVFSFTCPSCADILQTPLEIIRVIECSGTGKLHKAEMKQ